MQTAWLSCQSPPQQASVWTPAAGINLVFDNAHGGLFVRLDCPEPTHLAQRADQLIYGIKAVDQRAHVLRTRPDMGRRQIAHVYVFESEDAWENPEKIRIFEESGKGYPEFSDKVRAVNDKITRMNYEAKRRR